MPNTSASAPAPGPRFSIDSWAVALAFVVIALIFAGTLPRIPW
jgi:hypothetical protein